MKHIKKKPMPYIPTESDERDYVWVDVPNMQAVKQIDLKKHRLRLFDEDNNCILGFVYNHRGTLNSFPVSNPVLIYFHMAQTNLRLLKSENEKLKGGWQDDGLMGEKQMMIFYDFFGYVSTYVIMLMTAIEAFVNQKIPVGYKHEMPDGQGKFTKVYDHDQIQRNLSLDIKFKILAKVTGLHFFSSSHKKQETVFKQLKEFRDDIVHTKASGETLYEELYRTSLKFNYDEAIDTVTKIINFYDANLLEPCPCENDY